MSGGISASTVAVAATGMQVAGTVASTYAAYNKSRADKSGYEYQAQVSANNAQYAEWQAQDAITRGQRTEQNSRMKTAQLKSSQRASLAARGVALDEGSPLDILTSTDYMGELDANTISDNAAREAWALREGARGSMSNADLLRSRADAENPLFSAGSTFLTGAGAVASSWYRYRKEGIKGF